MFKRPDTIESRGAATPRRQTFLGMIHMKKKLHGVGVALLMATGLLVAPAGFAIAQGAAASAPQSDAKTLDQEVDLLRKDIRSGKKQLIAANLTLSDKEATAFWPVYDQYTAELVKINDSKYAIIKQYAQNADTMTDAQYNTAVKSWTNMDVNVAQLRLKYVPLFQKVLTPKNTARFFQMDRRLQNMIDLQLASFIPLVQP
jgi:hypothetical protein